MSRSCKCFLNSAPFYTPAFSGSSAFCPDLVTSEEDLDDIAPTQNLGRQGGVNSLVSNDQGALEVNVGATAPLQQGCSVPVGDGQVVVGTAKTVLLNVVRRVPISGHVKFNEF